jgi:general secretion pathway protein G
MRRTFGNGFTLVEILIAVAVIGMLAALAIPKISKSRDMARIKQCESDLAMIEAAVDQLAWDTGKWPGGIARNVQSSSEMWVLNTANAGLLTYNSALFTNWKGPYIRSIPKDPWGMDYFFDPDYYIGGKVECVVGSFGPNRKGKNLYDSDDIYIVLKRVVKP